MRWLEGLAVLAVELDLEMTLGLDVLKATKDPRMGLAMAQATVTV